MEFIQIEVSERSETGSAAMRRLRRAGNVPAVLYGLGRRNLALTLPGSEVERFLATGSHLVELKMGGEARQAIIREVQHDALNDSILHIDFHRVDESAEVEAAVLIEYKGEAPGTKEGGIFQALLETLNLRARPADLPRKVLIEIDQLGMGDAIRLSDVTVPDRVTLIGAPETLVAHVTAPKAVAEDDAEGDEAADGAPAEGEAAAPAAE